MKLKNNSCFSPSFNRCSWLVVNAYQASADAADTMVDISGKKVLVDIGITGIKKDAMVTNKEHQHH